MTNVSNESEARSSKIRRCLSSILVVAVGWGLSTGGLYPARAVTIGPNDAGIAQGNLVNQQSAYQDQVLAAVRDSGAKWIRLDLYWSEVETAQGTYNWTKYDTLYEKAHKAVANGGYGLNLLLVAGTSPAWATDPSCNNASCPPDLLHKNNWLAFMQAAANRYKPGNANNLQTDATVYEVWNEPNLANNFKPAANASTYVNNVLIPAFQGVTAALPTATVLTGGTAPSYSSNGNLAPWEFIKNLYAAGGKNYFHHVAHHPYTWPDSPTAGDASWNAFMQMDTDFPATGVVSIRTTMNNNNDGGKKIWATEAGNPSQGCVNCTEAAQKDNLARIYNQWAKKDWAGKIFWYAMVDDSGAPAGSEQYFGLKRVDYTAKPALDWFSKIVAQKYSSDVLAEPSLVHYWKLDELSGTNAANAKTTSATGFYVGNPTRGNGSDNVVVGTPAPTFQEVINNRVDVSYNDSAIRLAGAAWTVEFSARRAGGTLNWPGLMARGDASTKDGWLIYDYHQGGDSVSFKRNAQECRTTNTVLSDGKTHHFALTYSGSTLRWYVDGSAAGSCAISFPVPSTAQANLWIGASPDSPSNSNLGQVAIYNTALSASSVSTHANDSVRLP